MDQTELSAFSAIDPRVEIRNLKEENNDLMKAIESMQLQYRNSNLRHQEEKKALEQGHARQLQLKSGEILLLKAELLSQEENLQNTLKFVEDFRQGVRLVLEQRSPEEIKRSTSSENHAMLLGICDVSEDSKIRLLNQENQSLLKRCAYLKGETDMLRDELANSRKAGLLAAKPGPQSIVSESTSSQEEVSALKASLDSKDK